MREKIKQLHVFLYGDEIGILGEDIDGRHVFTYKLDGATRADLSLSMPRRQEPWRGNTVESYLDGLLPDSHDARQRLARAHGVTANNSFSLLTAVGLDCGGAVQFAINPTDVTDAQRQDSLKPISEAEIGRRLQAMHHSRQPSWKIDDEHWSLGGAQDKIALQKVDGQWFEALGSAATTHIIKPGIYELHQEAFNEFICMNMLAQLGVPAAKTTFQMFGLEPALVSKRWDRQIKRSGDSARQVQRIHQEDLCQAMSVPVSLKYQADGGPDAVDVVEFLRANSFAETDVLMFVMALVFNFLIAGTDAHAKNYAILEPADGSLHGCCTVEHDMRPVRGVGSVIYWIL